MVSNEVIIKIKHLLAESKYSQRTIADMVGVSRGTVNAIALGKRRFTETDTASPERPIFRFPKGIPCRCPLCGALVKSPCLACQIRTMKRFEEETSA